MTTELPKGMKLLLGMMGISPEALQNPAVLLRSFGINPDLIQNEIAKFEQIGLRVERAFNSIDARLARIEVQLGIAPADHTGTGTSHDGADGGDVDRMDRVPPDRRN